jgi:hypothetical protein
MPSWSGCVSVHKSCDLASILAALASFQRINTIYNACGMIGQNCTFDNDHGIVGQKIADCCGASSYAICNQRTGIIEEHDCLGATPCDEGTADFLTVYCTQPQLPWQGGSDGNSSGMDLTMDPEADLLARFD